MSKAEDEFMEKKINEMIHDGSIVEIDKPKRTGSFPIFF